MNGVDARKWGANMVPTQDHKLIREWADRYNAFPAEIRQLKFDGQPAILTFVIGDPDIARPHIYPISWEAFFAQFDLLKLSMAFDDASARLDIVRVEKRLSELPH